MTEQIRPALTPQQWKAGRAGSLSLGVVDDELHVVVRDPDDGLVSISGPDDLWALIALANEAMPTADIRKLVVRDVAVIHMLAESCPDTASGRRLRGLAETVGEKLASLLPASRQDRRSTVT
jgi:hypothetical protein